MGRKGHGSDLISNTSTLKAFQRIGENGIHQSGRARLLSESLFRAWDDALLFRILATLRLDVPVFDTVEDLRSKGPRPTFGESCERMKSPGLLGRATSAKSTEIPGG